MSFNLLFVKDLHSTIKLYFNLYESVYTIHTPSSSTCLNVLMNFEFNFIVLMVLLKSDSIVKDNAIIVPTYTTGAFHFSL